MSTESPAPVTNRLIEGLAPNEGQRLLGRCERVELVSGDVLCEHDEPYSYAYFPIGGIISLVTVVAGLRHLEMGLIGNEGMLGATLVLGVKAAPMRAVVQSAGAVWRMSAGQFQKELHATTALRRTVYRYLYVLLTQFAQSAACTHFHEIEPRLARWLLMTHDRARADDFYWRLGLCLS